MNRRSSFGRAFGLTVCLVLTAPVVAAAQSTEIQNAVQSLEQTAAALDSVGARLSAANAEDRPAFEFQRRNRWRDHHAALVRLADLLARDDADASESQRQVGETGLQRDTILIEEWLDDDEEALDSQASVVEEADDESRVEAEAELASIRARIDELLTALVEDYEHGAVFGLDTAAVNPRLNDRLLSRAERLGAVVDLSVSRVEELRDRAGIEGVDTVAVDLRIAALEQRIDGATTSLQAMADLLERRGVDVSRYRAQIISGTGQLGTEVLDRRVLGGLVSRWFDSSVQWFRENIGIILLRIGMVGVLVLIAFRVSKLAESVTRRVVRRMQVSNLIKNLMVAGASKMVWLIGAFVALSLIGINLAPMLAGLGIAGFVLGFALQETLANFASGLMIMIYRPFDVGDFVTTGGVTGEVKDLTLVSTVVATLDNQRIIIPNGKVWGDVINNATAETIRRVDMVFGISYDEDVDRAIAVLKEIISDDERVLEEPAPNIRVDSLSDSSVDLIVRPWCKTEDRRDVYWDTTRTVKKRFDEEGIVFPFPQRDVHLYHETAVPPLDPFTGPPEEEESASGKDDASGEVGEKGGETGAEDGGGDEADGKNGDGAA